MSRASQKAEALAITCHSYWPSLRTYSLVSSYLLGSVQYEVWQCQLSPFSFIATSRQPRILFTQRDLRPSLNGPCSHFAFGASWTAPDRVLLRWDQRAAHLALGLSAAWGLGSCIGELHLAQLPLHHFLLCPLVVTKAWSYHVVGTWQDLLRNTHGNAPNR